MNEFTVTKAIHLSGDDIGKRIAFTTNEGDPVTGVLSYFSINYYREGTEFILISVDDGTDYQTGVGHFVGADHEIKVNV